MDLPQKIADGPPVRYLITLAFGDNLELAHHFHRYCTRLQLKPKDVVRAAVEEYLLKR